jgi:hypothetical protein
MPALCASACCPHTSVGQCWELAHLQSLSSKVFPLVTEIASVVQKCDCFSSLAIKGGSTANSIDLTTCCTRFGKRFTYSDNLHSKQTPAGNVVNRLTVAAVTGLRVMQTKEGKRRWE